MKPLTLLMLLFICCSFSLQTAPSQHKSNSQSFAVPMGTYGFWDYQSTGSMLKIYSAITHFYKLIANEFS